MVKNKRVKETKIVNEDVTQVRNLIIILVVVVAVCTGIYFLTDAMIKKENNNDVEEVKEVEVNYNIASVGTMFNRPESEYYVIIYSEEDDGYKYDNILNTYRNKEDSLKTYYIDLDKKINSHILTDELNKKPTNSKEVTVTGATLYKIKNGKVTNCYSTLETITDALK